MQPGLAGLVGQGFQPARQLMRLGTRNHRVPHQVAAGRKALQAIGNAVADLAVVALDFVTGVDQHQRTARSTGRHWRRNKGLQPFKAIGTGDGDLARSVQLGDVAGQRLVVGRVQFKQLEPVARAVAQQRLHHKRRTGVDLQAPARVEAGHHVQVVLHRGHYVFDSCFNCIGGGKRRKKLDNPVDRLAPLGRIVTVQPVQAGARMAVDQGQRRVLLHQVLEDGNQRQVLEHIGVVARMESVAVTEHGGMKVFPKEVGAGGGL